MVKKRFSNQFSFIGLRFNKSKVTSPKPQEGKRGRFYVEKPLSSKCDNRHDGKFLVGSGNF